MAASLTVSLDRDTITLGESATLSLAFSGTQPQGTPTLPEIPGLQITSIGQSSQFSFGMGQNTSTVSYNYSVTAQRAGDYTIPALKAEIGGEKLSSQPVTLKVLKPNAPAPEAIQSGAQLAFLKIVLPRKELYVGETVSAQLQLFVNTRMPSVSGFQVTGFPADGFTVGKLQEAQHSQVRIGSGVYQLIPLLFTLRPTRTGTLALGPVTATAVLGQRDAFDPFGMFGRNEQKQVTLATEPIEVQALALPQVNVPPGFNGAIGTYTLTLTAGPTNVTAGDPITVKAQIAGKGTLDSLSLPDQPAWNEFKTYPPTTKVDTTDPLGLQGTKTFEQVVVPQNAEIKALPGLSFTYFDPEKKSYQTLTQPAIPLIVRPAGATPAPLVVTGSRSREEAPPPAQGIVPNKQRLGTLAAAGAPLARQSWFLALQGVPVLALIAAAAWRRRTNWLANNPRVRRQRQVAETIRAGMADLRASAAANKSDDFFAGVFRLLQEQLGERLDLPASAITEAVIEERLRPRGVPDTTLTPLHELFQACNQARYAPAQSSRELTAVIPKLEAVLRDLKELKA